MKKELWEDVLGRGNERGGDYLEGLNLFNGQVWGAAGGAWYRGGTASHPHVETSIDSTDNSQARPTHGVDYLGATIHLCAYSQP